MENKRKLVFLNKLWNQESNVYLCMFDTKIIEFSKNGAFLLLVLTLKLCGAIPPKIHPDPILMFP